MRPALAALARIAAVAAIVLVALAWHRPPRAQPRVEPAAGTVCTGRAHAGAPLYTLVVEPTR